MKVLPLKRSPQQKETVYRKGYSYLTTWEMEGLGLSLFLNSRVYFGTRAHILHAVWALLSLTRGDRCATVDEC